MSEITVTFDPADVFTLSDVARRVGVTASAAARWYRRNADSPGVPVPLFVLGGTAFFDGAVFGQFISAYERARELRGL